MAKRPKGTPGTVSAAHSYLHLVRQNGLHPYIKWPRATVPKVSSWAVSDLCKAYDWPTDAPGGGVIAIIELGGGWTQEDITKFFADANLHAPHITDVSVDGTTNSQCNPRNDADAEVALDIQVAGAAYAVATGKAANIRVYWSQDITKAIIAATADGCDVCSISWGADEASWGATDGNALEQAAIAATSAGMVVFAASGDNDSSDGGPGRANVDLPASAPHVIGCGGTHKPHSGEETVWKTIPGRPPERAPGAATRRCFRCRHGRPARLTAQAAWSRTWPRTPIRTLATRSSDGDRTVVGGTSAVAPLTPGYSRLRNEARLRHAGIVLEQRLLHRHHARRQRGLSRPDWRRPMHRSWFTTRRNPGRAHPTRGDPRKQDAGTAGGECAAAGHRAANSAGFLRRSPASGDYPGSSCGSSHASGRNSAFCLRPNHRGKISKNVLERRSNKPTQFLGKLWMEANARMTAFEIFDY